MSELDRILGEIQTELDFLKDLVNPEEVNRTENIAGWRYDEEPDPCEA